MLKFAMAFVAVALFVTPCLAQSAGGAEGQQSAEVGSSDAARLAAARRVVAANGSINGLRFAVERLIPDMIAPVARAEGLNAEQTATVTRIMSEEMMASSDDLIELIARVYANRMSTEDLTTLATFYESEAGRHYIAAMPTILNDSAAASTVWAEQVLAPRLAQRVREYQESRHRLNP